MNRLSRFLVFNIPREEKECRKKLHLSEQIKQNLKAM